MKKFLIGAVAAFAAISMSTTASAADYFPGDPQFQVTGDINNGTISADIGSNGILAGSFSDRFLFTIDQNGFGSGSVSTSASFFNSVLNLDIASVMINGLTATKISDSQGLVEFFSITGVPITFGVENVLEITGTSRGNGSYGGNLTFEPAAAVPEASTWAMMIIGLGMTGGVLRRRRKTASRVAFA